MSESSVPTMHTRSRGDTSRTLEKGLRLLALFDVEHQEWSPKELREQLGEPKTVVLRLIKTLEGMGFLERDAASGRLALGSSVARMAYVTQSHSALVRVARPFMEKLSKITGETIDISVEAEPGRPLILSVITARYLIPQDLIGKESRPPLQSAASKLFVAFGDQADWARFLADDTTSEDSDCLRAELLRARQDGVAFELNGRNDEIGVVASPVFGPDGGVRASLSVITAAERFGAAQMTSHALAVRQIAADMSEELGAPPGRLDLLRSPLSIPGTSN